MVLPTETARDLATTDSRLETPIGTDDPCRGSDLLLSEVESRCIAPTGARLDPDSSHLQVTLSPASIRVEQGEESVAQLIVTNTGEEAQTFDFIRGCNAVMNVSIRDGQGHRVDVDYGDCSGGLGLCGTGPALRVTLMPGGRLRARIPVSTAIIRWRLVGEDQCTSGPDGFLPPGTYRLRVSSPSGFQPEFVETDLIVEPRSSM